MKSTRTGFGLASVLLWVTPITAAAPPDRQGGETCETATSIRSLPFTADGTTIGYNDDYAQMCPYGNWAPDAVYSFSPTADMSIDITLCAGITDYDTLLLVYEDSCVPLAYACNDDACTAPEYQWGPYVSALWDMPVFAGHTYYIVVDGYVDSCGDYTLQVRVSPPPAQGGDRCETATDITALPFNAEGTTVAYYDDYDEVCPYQGSTAPDVVYSYTAYYNTLAYLTLCLDVTDYDSKLYVYEDECTPGTAIACNDDACSSPAYPIYVSEIPYVWFLEGHTYYIVVDGYAAQSGAYQLTIDEIMFPPPPECPADTVYGQRAPVPQEQWTAYSSDAWWPYLAYESFSDLFASILRVGWWGFDLRFTADWEECDLPDPAPFVISFYADDGEGAPAWQYPLYTYDVLAYRQWVDTYDEFDMWYFEADLWLPPYLAEGWIAIQGNSQTDCVFRWLSSPEGDGLLYQLTPDGVLEPHSDDLSLCIMGQVDPYIGACCNDATGECVDDALAVDCVGPNMRFGPNVLCVDLDPPCGTGGCCFGYRCADTPLSEESCLTLGGEFLGCGVSCTDTLCDCGGSDYRGDANCLGDGPDAYDIDHFIQAVGAPAVWMGTHACNIYCANDVNCDGDVNAYDIDWFITCVGSGVCDPCP